MATRRREERGELIVALELALALELERSRRRTSEAQPGLSKVSLGEITSEELRFPLCFCIETACD